jgi:glycosyltransferase involved in cell wall biosynthesis
MTPLPSVNAVPTEKPLKARSALTVRRLARKVRRFSIRHIYPRLPSLHNFIFFEMRRKAIACAALVSARQLHILPSVLFSDDVEQARHAYQPTVSIIVPCYNHGKYLRQRLESIAQQTYAHVEVILLDDASSDDSTQYLRDYAQAHSETCRISFNSENSGSPFRQWQKGLQMARGNLIWIAESDDFCAPDFLEKMVPLFSNEAVMLAFSRIDFVDSSGSQSVWSMQQYLPELSRRTWRRPFTITATQLVHKIWNRKNIIPNVSSAVFRNPTDLSLLSDPEWLSMRVCGDWLFYLQIAAGGLVAYTPATACCYRQHGTNSSVLLHKQEIYLAEHLSVASYLMRMYPFAPEVCQVMQKELRRRWELNCVNSIPLHLEEKIQHLAISSVGQGSRRKPNLLIVTYSLIPGGGEILPLRLANLLKQRGYTVSVLNCHQHANQPGVRSILRSDIPLLEMKSLESLSVLVSGLGVDIVHSHHAWVDTTVAELLHGVSNVSHVITSHGMYDEIAADEIDRIGMLLCPWVKQFTYVADKNRAPLLALGATTEQLTKVPNAIDVSKVEPIERASLGISEEAFVLCIVSRGIREKGWQEAIEAVQLAQSWTQRPLHLLIAGDGPELYRLQPKYASETIHFLGFHAHPYNLYATADLGILPSFYPGESQPLSLIECLTAGRPFLASDIGEIRAMLTTPSGMAGVTVPLQDGCALPQAFAESILAYVNQPDIHLRHCELARQACKAFSPDAMANAYEAIYARALTTGPVPTS